MFVWSAVLCLCVLSVYPAGCQAWDVDPMPGYCWPTVYDAQPTSAQYWVTVSCLTPRWMRPSVTDGRPTLTQLWFKASWPYRQHASTFCMYVAYDRLCVRPVLVHCWPTVCGAGSALSILFCCDDDGGYCSVDSSISLVLIWCWAVVVGGGPALNQHWAFFSCLMGEQMTKNIDFELSYYHEYNITSFFQFLLTNQVITT